MLNTASRLQLEQIINQLNLADLKWLLELVLKQIEDNIPMSNQVTSTPHYKEEPVYNLADLIAQIKDDDPSNPARPSLGEGLTPSTLTPDPTPEIARWDEQ